MVAAELVARSKVGDRLERQAGRDRVGAVAEQAGARVRVADVVSLDDERAAGAQAGRDESCLHRAECQQRGKRRALLVRPLVGEDDDAAGAPCGRLGVGGNALEGLLERLAGERRIEPRSRHRSWIDEEGVQLEQRRRRALREQRRTRAEQRGEREHPPLPQVVDRRVRHLREALTEVREQGPRTPGEGR